MEVQKKKKRLFQAGFPNTSTICHYSADGLAPNSHHWLSQCCNNGVLNVVSANQTGGEKSISIKFNTSTLNINNKTKL